MNQYILVALLSFCIFIVTFTMGYLPRIFTNKRVLQLLSVFGGGILLGVAFLVILPESVAAVVNASI
jgi:hypothetical protein